MSPHENPVPSRTNSSFGGGLVLWARSLGRVNVLLGGILILAMVATTVLACFLRGDNTGGGVEVGFIFLFFIPVVSLPVVFFCLAGIIVSVSATRRFPNGDARTGLWQSLLVPIVVVICYVVCWRIMLIAGV